MTCRHCGNEISQERKKAFAELGLNEPDTCVKCADIGKKRPVAHQIFGHKTAGEMMWVSGEDPNYNENVRRLKLGFNGRSGRGSSGG